MIVNDMRPVLKKEAPGVIDTWDNLYAFFLGRAVQVDLGSPRVDRAWFQRLNLSTRAKEGRCPASNKIYDERFQTFLPISTYVPTSGARARQPAHLPVLLTRGREVQHARAQLPGPHQRLHHRLVPAMAPGRVGT